MISLLASATLLTGDIVYPGILDLPLVEEMRLQTECTFWPEDRALPVRAQGYQCVEYASDSQFERPDWDAVLLAAGWQETEPVANWLTWERPSANSETCERVGIVGKPRYDLARPRTENLTVIIVAYRASEDCLNP